MYAYKALFKIMQKDSKGA